MCAYVYIYSSGRFVFYTVTVGRAVSYCMVMASWEAGGSRSSHSSSDGCKQGATKPMSFRASGGPCFGECGAPPLDVLRGDLVDLHDMSKVGTASSQNGVLQSALNEQEAFPKSPRTAPRCCEGRIRRCKTGPAPARI